MKSIKPGRGPSFMQGIASIAGILFGAVWTAIAASLGGRVMVPFGLIFMGVGVANAIYSFKNATGENRYSSFDIVDSAEEPDPLNQRFGSAAQSPDTQSGILPSSFCPYCGAPAEGDFRFCNRCGKELP
ncbi:MAG: zinc ribbon domain-containing protein [Oscillospiraceae bacterium]|nr:zinc ribbon domain-containing protein [Oscillospiraceae bacterium]